MDSLERLITEASIPERYVDPACNKQDVDEQGKAGQPEEMGGLDAYMDAWLNERGKVHMSLLGEFGTGKTWFCRHYALRQLKRYLDDPANERLPLLITLRDFVKTTRAEQLINDLLAERYKLPFVGSAFDVFRELNRTGKLLLILDGFDEMARRVDYQTVVDNFWELARLVDDRSKVILTSRTEYFRWAKESEKVLGGREKAGRLIELVPPRFEVLYLSPFDDARIGDMIRRRLGAEKGPETARKILEHENLKEMARKPVLVDLLLAALDETGVEALEDEARIYLHATHRLLLRNIETQRTFTSTADKLFFLCELAWEMIRTGELRIHYKAIPERIRTYFGEKIQDEHELDHWDADLRNQTLLHRDVAGYYEFAHKSLAEYFVALKFGAELGMLEEEYAQGYQEEDGSSCDLNGLDKDPAGLATGFGALSLSDERLSAVVGFLGPILDRKAGPRLWEIIDCTRDISSQDSGFVGGNAAAYNPGAQRTIFLGFAQDACQGSLHDYDALQNELHRSQPIWFTSSPADHSTCMPVDPERKAPYTLEVTPCRL